MIMFLFVVVIIVCFFFSNVAYVSKWTEYCDSNKALPELWWIDVDAFRLVVLKWKYNSFEGETFEML